MCDPPGVWRSSRSPEDRRRPVIRWAITLVEKEEKTWTEAKRWPGPWPCTYAKFLKSHFDGKQGSKTNSAPPLFLADDAIRRVCTAGEVLTSIWHHSEAETELQIQAKLEEYEWDLWWSQTAWFETASLKLNVKWLSPLKGLWSSPLRAYVYVHAALWRWNSSMRSGRPLQGR